MLALKRLVTVYPHRPWRLPRRLLALLIAAGFLAWLFGYGKPWPRHPKEWRDGTIDADTRR